MRGNLKRISEEPTSEKSIKLEEIQEHCKDFSDSQRFGMSPDEMIEEIERLKTSAKICQKKLLIEEEFKKNYLIKSREKVEGLLSDFLVVLKDKDKVIQALREDEEKVEMKDQQTSTENLEISKDFTKTKRNKAKNQPATSKSKHEIAKPKKKLEILKPKAELTKSKSEFPKSEKENIFHIGQMPKRIKTRKGPK